MVALLVFSTQAAELYDASPSLAPWRIKGRLLVKVSRQAYGKSHTDH
jgi:hypothetical protein